MREILFRGKKEYNGEWVFGSLHIEYGETDINGNRNIDYRILGMHGECDYVIPESVGQFTGLTDKNSKKIFECDIVESKYTKKPYIVLFGNCTYTNEYGDDENFCGWYNKDENGYVTPFGDPDDWAFVIGNIHDYPELLKGENNG